MTDGLIATYTGRMVLCGILAFLGLLGSGALTLITHARKGLPLTTQTNRITGERQHGIFRWFVTFAAFLAGPWLLLMVALTGTHLAYAAAGWVQANWWVLPIVGVLAIIALAVWVLVRWQRPPEHESPRVQMAALTEHVPAAEVAPIWTAPDLGGKQWSDH